MPTLTMPTSPYFSGARFNLLANTQTFTSPLDRTVQTLELPGARWAATYSLPAMTAANAGAWQAFLVNLMGASGRFHGFDPARTSPEGIYSSGSDTPLVAGASQTGSTLATDGWRTSGTGLLLPGDYFEVGGELKMVTAQVDSDGGGAVTISFRPQLRASPANNAGLTLADPRATMMLTGDAEAAWAGGLAGIVDGMAFSAVEAFA